MLSKSLTIRVALFLSFAIFTTCRTNKISEEEKVILLTADYLKPYGYNFNSHHAEEHFEKSKIWDGSVLFSYKFKTKADYPEFLSLEHQLKIIDSIPKAELSYKSQDMILEISNYPDAELRPLRFSFSYGDESKIFLVVKDGRPIGNIFRFRNGLVVSNLHLMGAYFDQEKHWMGFIQDYLQKMEKHLPNHVSTAAFMPSVPSS